MIKKKKDCFVVVLSAGQNTSRLRSCVLLCIPRPHGVTAARRGGDPAEQHVLPRAHCPAAAEPSRRKAGSARGELPLRHTALPAPAVGRDGGRRRRAPAPARQRQSPAGGAGAAAGKPPRDEPEGRARGEENSSPGQRPLSARRGRVGAGGRREEPGREQGVSVSPPAAGAGKVPRFKLLTEKFFFKGFITPPPPAPFSAQGVVQRAAAPAEPEPHVRGRRRPTGALWKQPGNAWARGRGGAAGGRAGPPSPALPEQVRRGPAAAHPAAGMAAPPPSG